MMNLLIISSLTSVIDVHHDKRAVKMVLSLREANGHRFMSSRTSADAVTLNHRFLLTGQLTVIADNVSQCSS